MNIGKYFILLCLVFSGQVTGIQKDKQDLTQFDFPFLIGDWHLVNTLSGSGNDAEDYLSIRLQLKSSYMFAVQIHKKDSSVEYWEGDYTADGNTLTLGAKTLTPQVYSYSATHNQLMLNGVIFYKALSRALVGVWESHQISGYERTDTGVEQLQLILQPDFIFSIRVQNDRGKEVVHQGVYYTESDHLVFLFEDGEHDAKFELEANQMVLNLEDGAILATLKRIY
ncbi:hypothetical protein VA7868_04386 [Vibrio aerogenes CECT 7868]|uniref:Lipocalin-like domain-containing protein n=1 Tax=Vibrio aerogenes CECT 7868 TaxID=1216006 RepID=A0A1M6E1Y3_9VIBR|nr:hypothetical protein [Vibrio aerogenes]SHI79534.1 hypothetical protein VA7868_04386 [Vibrio aerogenes CECT 7868]